MTPISMMVITAVIVFSLGAASLVQRRNPMALLMGAELMLNASILLLVASSRVHGTASSQGAALLVLVLGAAEAVIGLGLALAVFRNRTRVDLDDAREVQR
jgi:NADH-quinone oxidoreductase subunit K